MYHANKDRKVSMSLTLFLFTGIALKLNERPFEPRERYIVGSFYVLLYGLIWVYTVRKCQKYLAPSGTTNAASILAAPVLMASQNWDDHDRSGSTYATMAKSILTHVIPNAILFTIGK
jgi:hypothetical protein